MVYRAVDASAGTSVYRGKRLLTHSMEGGIPVVRVWGKNNRVLREFRGGDALACAMTWAAR